MQPTVTSLRRGQAVHKVHYAILDQFCLPPSVTLCHTSQDLLKYVAHIGPQFLVVHAYIHVFRLQGVCVSSRGSLFGGLSGRFRTGWFLSVPLLVIVIVNSKLPKCHSKAKRRAPPYSRALRQIRGVFQRIVCGRRRSVFQRVRECVKSEVFFKE